MPRPRWGWPSRGMGNGPPRQRVARSHGRGLPALRPDAGPAADPASVLARLCAHALAAGVPDPRCQVVALLGQGRMGSGSRGPPTSPPDRDCVEILDCSHAVKHVTTVAHARGGRRIARRRRWRTATLHALKAEAPRRCSRCARSWRRPPPRRRRWSRAKRRMSRATRPAGSTRCTSRAACPLDPAAWKAPATHWPNPGFAKVGCTGHAAGPKSWPPAGSGPIRAVGCLLDAQPQRPAHEARRHFLSHKSMPHPPLARAGCEFGRAASTHSLTPRS